MMGKRWIEAFFYANFFYGLCVVASAVETLRLVGLPWQFTELYILLFAATVLFYNYPYARLETARKSNARAIWHVRHRKKLRFLQVVLTLLIAFLSIRFLMENMDQLEVLSAQQILLAIAIPLLGLLYYGLNVSRARYNLRSIGLLKPFIIGLVWAGVTVVYPELYVCIVSGQPVTLDTQSVILFTKTVLFIALLAMMFDIKDYSADSRNRLQTIVVRVGLRRTLFRVILPSAVVILLSLTFAAVVRDFGLVRTILFVIPVLALFPAAYSLRKRRSLLFYLAAIDGIILLKAVCGIAASYF
jgi:4-hydroxybenzoate polyprenyltransferase